MIPRPEVDHPGIGVLRLTSELHRVVVDIGLLENPLAVGQMYFVPQDITGLIGSDHGATEVVGVEEGGGPEGRVSAGWKMTHLPVEN